MLPEYGLAIIVIGVAAESFGVPIPGGIILIATAFYSGSTGSLDLLGAAGGTLGSLALGAVLPDMAPAATTMAVVGMAAIFTAVVRAPLTGFVMTIEMTGRADYALPMLTACLAGATRAP
jgi:CIC family chloride channel protein